MSRSSSNEAKREEPDGYPAVGAVEGRSVGAESAAAGSKPAVDLESADVPQSIVAPGRFGRRDFLRLAAKGAVVASVAPTLSGCGRVLEWSSRQRQAGDRQMATTPPSITSTSTSLSTSLTGPQTTTTQIPWPDLAVARGGEPEQLLRAALAELGGIGRFVFSGARVVLKPNVLTGRAPEYAVTTNPDLMAALVRLCAEAGAREVTVLDRPTSAARTAFEVSGIARAVEGAGARVKYLTDRNFENTAIPHGRLLTEWPLVTDVFEADVFINIPIAKTHSLAVVTLAMKNLMGIMGGTRGTIHVDFDQKIVDLNTLVRPHLVILDAYRMLIRHGPTGGDLRDVRLEKALVAGTNQASVDAYGATLFGLKPNDIGWLRRAKEQGLGETDISALSIAERRV